MANDVDKLAGPNGGPESMRLAKFWLDQINSVKDNSQMKRWIYRGETIIKRYRDERNRTDEEGQRRYNALWSNVEILKPALYGKTPLPVAERRFKDKDPTGRAAAQILERALRNEIEVNGFNEALEQAVSDYLLPGRGTVWVRYEPLIEESVSLPPAVSTDMTDAQGELPGRMAAPQVQSQDILKDGRRRPRLVNTDNVDDEDEKGPMDADKGAEQTPEADQNIDDEKAEDEQKLRETGDRIIRESVPIDFIEWHDFFIFPIRARNWAEVTAVGKRVYMSRDQAKRRFGKTIGRAIPLEKDNRGDRTQNTTLQAADEDKCQVYEIWNKEDETVYWVAMGYDYLCDRKDDPLNLEYFFPCPKPLFANPTNNTLIPVPDFIQYQDQAIQIDELTQRIAMLTKACKMAGVYNAAAKDIQRLFNESVENELIPVDDWAAFGKDGGGIEGNWSLMPVQDIQTVINELMTVKQKQIEEMDRLTGINDIMRGTSDARETLGGVRLKSNNTGTRLQARQNEVARFCRDTVRIMADIMCQHFSPQSLIEVSGALYEEGLGPEDMPDLTQLQNPQKMIPQQPQAGQASLPKPTQGPASPPAPPWGPAPQGGPQGAPNPTAPPQPPQGPPGMPPGMPQGGLPGQQPLNGQILPPQGQPDPQMMQQMQQQQAKFAALQRIATGIGLLRDEKMRGFRVDIEVDSTIYADAAQEKQDRTEFIMQVTKFLETSMQMGAMMPPAVPLLGKMLLFGVRGYRIGRDLEMAIEDFTDQATALAHQNAANQAQQPNPEMLKAQTEAKKAEAQIQSINIKSQAEQRSADAEVQRQQLQNQADQQMAQADIVGKQLEIQMRQMEMQIEKLRVQVESIKAHAEVQQSHANVEQAHAATQQAHAQTQQAHVQTQADMHRANTEAEVARTNADAQKHKATMDAMKPQTPQQPSLPAKEGPPPGSPKL